MRGCSTALLCLSGTFSPSDLSCSAILFEREGDSLLVKDRISRPWTLQEAAISINIREGLAVKMAADNWPQANASTAWCCDNTAFLGALRKGYSPEPTTDALLRSLYPVVGVSAYVPSEENPADALSRQVFDPASYPIGARVSSDFLQNLQFRDVDWR